MDKFIFLQLAFFLIGLALVYLSFQQSRLNGRLKNIAWVFLSVWALINILFNLFLWVNHLNFPLNLDLMEGTVLEHFQHAASFLMIYPQPTPAYVPLAYNPLYYVLAVPFSWVFGVNLFTLRLVAILGMLGIAIILFLVVRRETRSMGWGLMSVGLFAAAYRVMDAYLDTAHSDSWLIFSALLGSYLIYRNRSKWDNILGVVLLVASFWLKQHGAFFALGGLLFLTWREGIHKSIFYWILAMALGPILYIFAGPLIFGPYFHYFTWEVPRNWSELRLGTFKRYLGFILFSYPALALSGGALVLWTALTDRKRFNIWHFQFLAALLTGFMGSLDIGSSNNVYIPMGVWMVLVGTLGLHELAKRARLDQRGGLTWVALFISFAALLYNPLTVISSPKAGESYQDLIGLLNSLDGIVYAPSLGQLQNGYKFYPTAHWVALEDMIRGPGKDTRNNPNTRALLEPLIHPDGPAYILANYPLQYYPWIAFLEEYYVLETNYRGRFLPLRVLPKRWDHGWPRYLYRYAPDEVTSPSPVQ